ncbi:MAG: SUMF1/EgtB/PvdO family nonheme iron enzyme [Planctomycetaceae bacterium]
MTSAEGIEMVAIPAGTFVMGSAAGSADEAPPHPVTLDGFLMDRCEVTQGEYEQHVIGNPSKFKDPTNPVERVRWEEAALYCNARSSAEGLEPCYDETSYACNFNANGYRLPTEAEWEYAARAGATEAESQDVRRLGDIAWFKDNASERTHAVGTKKPNAWGLYDMYGNVGEWCQDIYDAKFYEQSTSLNPCNPSGNSLRTLRGGSWSSSAERCRGSSRSGEAPGSFADACFARPDIGFRCVRRDTPLADAVKTPAASESTKTP